MPTLRHVTTLILCAALAPFAPAQLAGDKPYTASAHAIPSIQDTETPTQRDARMAWWRAARFGMFIHWGLYSEAAGHWRGHASTYAGEWIMNDQSISVADYKTLAPTFNPTGFSAQAIVALAKSAGMKYIIITAKHHDGFAMFDSAANPFNIVAATPFHRDPLRELADEARKQHIKLGFYYSQEQDWTYPGGITDVYGKHDPATGNWDPAQAGSFDAYLHAKAIPQLKELLTNYGPDTPAVLWFDTPEKITPTEAAEVVTLLNQHPALIYNNRLGGGYTGDTETPEQFIPPNGFPGRDWESCMTMNGTWGYKTDDLDFKSTETLLRNLIDIASKGGNYLLNIGPDGNGTVPPAEVERLHAMGRWLALNGEAIYGTTATLFDTPTAIPDPTKKDKDGNPELIPTWDWRSTTTPTKVYVQIITWPAGPLHLGHLPRTVTSAYLLADPTHKPLHFKQSATGIEVTLPTKPLDPIATVLVLTTKT